jgi:hypothetical protein
MEKKGILNELTTKSKELDNTLIREKSMQERASQLNSLTSQNSQQNEQLQNQIIERDQKITTLNKIIDSLKIEIK